MRLFQITALALLVAPLASGCVRSGTKSADAGVNARVISTNANLSPSNAFMNNALDLDSARLALVVFLQNTTNTTLKAFLPNLSSDATDKSYDQLSIFGFGYCTVNLTHGLWYLDGPMQGSSQWEYRGNFRKDLDGRWQAVYTGGVEHYFRGDGGRR